MKIYLSTLATALLMCSGIHADQIKEAAPVKKVPMTLELPKAMFVGTPVKFKVPNLQKPTGKPRPPFMVPEGSSNVAEGKEVTSSDDFPIIGDLEMLTDADKEGSDGSYVELGPGVQWVQVDLEAAHTIDAVLVWHFHSQPRAYHDVIIQISDDPDFITGVKSVYNNDHDNSAGIEKGDKMAYIETNGGLLVDTKGVQGRYVRLYSRGNSSNEMNHYVEVEIHGQEAK